MGLLRIAEATPLDGFRLRLRLTDGSVVERDVGDLLRGPALDLVRQDPAMFRAVRVEAGTIAWSTGADLCPDVVIWGGPPAHGAPLPTLTVLMPPLPPSDPTMCIQSAVK